ncbi:hypothetical protein ACFQ08_03170 [Streptosporangium algeriense]|uniref:Minor tail protein n=1 Tax=Streptosporangium algeriense TaxID=1682748 RepID=A0ABW3DJN4_9ACTN
MAAIVRSTETSVLHGSGSARRDAAEPGDLLLAFHSADGGGTSEMSMPGWDSVATIPGGPWAGTRIWRRTATASEPTEYSVTQRSTADGTVVIVAIRGGKATGIVVVPDGSGTTAPAASPPSASGLEFRYAAGLTQFGAYLSWSVPSGYTERADVQADVWTSAVLASKALTSNRPVDAVELTPSTGLYVSHAVTVIVASSGEGGSGGPPPTPPVFPAFTPARGSALYRYTVHDLLTGAYKDDIYPRDVYFDKRIGEPGVFNATLPIPNRQVAEQVAHVIPRTPQDLSTGPGAVVIHVWRDGALWGVYWLTAARPARSRGQKPAISLRGSTLDAYLHQVALHEDLNLEDDQIVNARDLITHMQTAPIVPSANIGLSLQGGSSGTVRPLAAKADDFYGKVLADYARVSGGFETMVNAVVTEAGIERRWVWGAPTLGWGGEHIFQEAENGGDILDWSEEFDVLRGGGIRVKVRGGTPPATDVTQDSGPVTTDWTASAPHVAAGWARMDRLLDHPAASTDMNTLEAYAARWMATSAGGSWVRSFTVALGAHPTIHPNLLGDRARMVMTNEWHPRMNGAASYDVSERLIGLGITPEARGRKEEAQLILESSAGGV